MDFTEIDPGGMGPCAVPGGRPAGTYGYAAGNRNRGGRAIRSDGYAPCNGIVTFDVSTAAYTLSHFPPGGPKAQDRADYLQFLAAQARPGSSLVWVVGGFPTRLADNSVVDGAPLHMLTAAGLDPPPRAPALLFTGPRGRACDVLVGTDGGFFGLQIFTRGGRGGPHTTQIDWSGL